MPINNLEITTEIQQLIQGSGMSRTERRAAKRKALKGGKPRPAMHAAILANARSGPLDEILEKYPMRPEDARVLSRYIAGDASAQDATIAFEASLRDPRWMMQWIGKMVHFSINSPLGFEAPLLRCSCTSMIWSKIGIGSTVRC
ncbi:MAG: hypothetical protein IPH54_19620 [Rhodoferax sp.]|nr:hypothetical protein [Rhodoferax sp.]